MSGISNPCVVWVVVHVLLYVLPVDVSIFRMKPKVKMECVTDVGIAAASKFLRCILRVTILVKSKRKDGDSGYFINSLINLTNKNNSVVWVVEVLLHTHLQFWVMLLTNKPRAQSWNSTTVSD